MPAEIARVLEPYGLSREPDPGWAMVSPSCGAVARSSAGHRPALVQVPDVDRVLVLVTDAMRAA